MSLFKKRKNKTFKIPSCLSQPAAPNSLLDVETVAAPDDTKMFCARICDNPIIIYLISFSIENLWRIHLIFRGQKIILLKGADWCSDENKNYMKYLKSAYFDKAKMIFPEHRLIFMSNSEEAHYQCRLNSIASAFVNQNCFIDERLFQPADKQKDFDCVYNARFSEIKRHELISSDINLSVITYFINEEERMLHDSFIQNNRCTLLNPSKGSSILGIRPKELSEHLCRARCGLMLSEVEGANYATVEYLLSGLPVVSTPSKGGRNEYLDPRYCTIVKPNKELIMQAILSYKEKTPDPEQVRNSTIFNMESFRSRFARLMDPIFQDMNNSMTTEILFRDFFFHKWLRWQTIGSLEEPFSSPVEPGFPISERHFNI